MVTTLSHLLAQEVLRPAMFSSIAVSKGATVRYNVLNENDESAVYEIALPGYDRNNIEVRYSNNRLTVSSRSKQSGRVSGYVVKTFDQADFSVSWAVSDSEVSKATFIDGVLKVFMSRSVNNQSDLVAIE
jgi:HSP20 family molecular chaperone IbpA